MRPLVPVAAVVGLLLASGCLGRDRPDFDGVRDEINLSAAPFLVQDHGSDGDHFDAALHNGSLNMDLVAYHNGLDESGDPNAINAVAPDGYYTEIAVTPQYAYLGRSSASGAYGGFSVLRLRCDQPAGPIDPCKVGEFKGLSAADLEVNENESLAFLAVQRNLPPQMAQGILGAQDPRAGLPRGIAVVNIEDKTNPTLESFVPLPVNGPHTLTYYAHPNGNEYVIVSTYDLVTDPGTGALMGTVPVTQRILVYQVVDKPGQVPDPLGAITDNAPATLVPVSQFTIPEQAPAGQIFLPHDTRVQVHPSYDGGARVLLYIAYWDKGLRIVDMTDPMALSEIGSSTDMSPSRLKNLHLAQPFDEAIDDRQVTVTQPEIPQVDGETGQLTFFDTTDPRSPQKVGRWTLPQGSQGQLSIAGFDYSPHNFDLWDGKVALGHFHAGVWVIDAGDAENLADPKTVGYYMPHVPRDNAPTEQPSVWGVFEVDGLLFAVDESTGLYVLRYTGP